MCKKYFEKIKEKSKYGFTMTVTLWPVKLRNIPDKS